MNESATLEERRLRDYPPGTSRLEVALTEALRESDARATRLRRALRDAMAFVDPETARDYPSWERLARDRGW